MLASEAILRRILLVESQINKANDESTKETLRHIRSAYVVDLMDILNEEIALRSDEETKQTVSYSLDRTEEWISQRRTQRAEKINTA